MSILFVSAFKDIGRGDWFLFNRTTDQYINWFLHVATKIEYPCIVFVEESVKIKLNQHKLSPHVIILDMNSVSTFYTRFLEKETHIIKSKQFLEKIPFYRQVYPETQSAEYNLVNHSKINYVRHAKQLYPHYDFYSWIDFGMFRDSTMIPKNLSIKEFPPSKIIFQSVKSPSQRISALDMLSSDDIYITGPSYVLPHSLVETYESLYEKKLLELHKQSIVDDDQSIVLQLFYDQPQLFHLYQDTTWFKLFKLLPHST